MKIGHHFKLDPATTHILTVSALRSDCSKTEFVIRAIRAYAEHKPGDSSPAVSPSKTENGIPPDKEQSMIRRAVAE